MTSTFHGIEISKRSLYTQMAAMNTTGHNISNANTDGYSRQVVEMVAARPIEAPGFSHSTAKGQLGMGVEVSQITRIRDTFLDDQYWDANHSLGEWEVQANSLAKLEKIFNEPSDSGIATVLNNFWKSWSELSKDPESLTARKIVKENAAALVDAFNETSKKLTNMQSDLNQTLTVESENVNNMASQIADLNDRIFKIEMLGDKANDLRDQRDLIIDELSKKGNVTVNEEEDGYRVVMGGVELVSGSTPNAVASQTWETAYNSSALSSGELFGIIKSRDVIVKDYLEQLDSLANTVANGDVTLTIPAGSVLPEGINLNGIVYNGNNRVLKSDLTVAVKGLNALHQLGYTYSSPATTGAPFFISSNGTISAGTIALNPVIANDPNQIASSMRTIIDPINGDETVKGNNTLALLMAQLKDASFGFKATSSNNGITQGTIDDYYRAMLGQLGVQASEANRQQSNNQLLVDQVQSKRLSVMGVSLDEEMANLIKFQHAYSAASRFMTTMDQNLDKVINSMGVVGR